MHHVSCGGRTDSTMNDPVLVLPTNWSRVITSKGSSIIDYLQGFIHGESLVLCSLND